jgi:hypothetical protein
VITIPKTTKWSDYEKELEAVADRKMVLNYRLSFSSKAKPGDRCFVVYDGLVKRLDGNSRRGNSQSWLLVSNY